jgi:hypothetical protein
MNKILSTNIRRHDIFGRVLWTEFVDVVRRHVLTGCLSIKEAPRNGIKGIPEGW